MMMIGELQEVEEKTPFTHRVSDSSRGPLATGMRKATTPLHKQNDMPLQQARLGLNPLLKLTKNPSSSS